MVRRDLERLLDDLTGVDWHELSFIRSGAGIPPLYFRTEPVLALPSGQIVMDQVLEDLTEFLVEVREQWASRTLNIVDFDLLVSDAAILGGSPVSSKALASRRRSSRTSRRNSQRLRSVRSSLISRRPPSFRPRRLRASISARPRDPAARRATGFTGHDGRSIPRLIGASHDLSFRTLRTEAPGLKDPDIPDYCRREGLDALVSSDVRRLGSARRLSTVRWLGRRFSCRASPSSEEITHR